jgi:hypothetical protein
MCIQDDIKWSVESHLSWLHFDIFESSQGCLVKFQRTMEEIHLKSIEYFIEIDSWWKFQTFLLFFFSILHSTYMNIHRDCWNFVCGKTNLYSLRNSTFNYLLKRKVYEIEFMIDVIIQHVCRKISGFEKCIQLVQFH